MFQTKLSLAMLMILPLWAVTASASNADDLLYVGLTLFSDGDTRRQLETDLPTGPMPGDEAFEDFYLSFLISGGSVYNYTGLIIDRVGEVVDCDGLYGQCLEIKYWIKIYIPADFEFGKQAEWEWKDCNYSTTSFRNYQLLGQSVRATEILVSCSDNEWVNDATIEYDTQRGVVSFEIRREAFVSKFILSNPVGFLANIE